MCLPTRSVLTIVTVATPVTISMRFARESYSVLAQKSSLLKRQRLRVINGTRKHRTGRLTPRRLCKQNNVISM